MSASVEAYLYPRVCPILALSREDVTRAVELYGSAQTLTGLATLIINNYDFPYARACQPRVPAPLSLDKPRFDSKTTPSPQTMLLGGYRCTRLSSDERIPGITLLMHDTLSRSDWLLDSFMEQHRMKCWVAVQGKTRRWSETDTRNDLRSPYARATHLESLSKLLETHLLPTEAVRPSRTRLPDDSILTHDCLREALIGHGEATPPTTEFYLQIIAKLQPLSIFAPQVSYGVSIAALACVAGRDTPCYYSLDGLTPGATASLREFISETGHSPTTELIEGETRTADLIFLDVIPYGTHDLRAYLGEQSTPRHLTYAGHLRRYVITPLRKLVQENAAHTGPPTRVALVSSLRELPAQPIIEPMLLAIMSDAELGSHIEIVGALVAKKRDYAAYLMLLHSTPREPNKEWRERLQDLYPEAMAMFNSGEQEAVSIESSQRSSTRPAPAATWEVMCLKTLMASPSWESAAHDGVALQGPRVVRGKAAFPTRTRTRVIESETHNSVTGDIVFVFGSIVEPAAVVVSQEPEIADPLISRIVNGIRESMMTDSQP